MLVRAVVERVEVVRRRVRGQLGPGARDAQVVDLGVGLGLDDRVLGKRGLFLFCVFVFSLVLFWQWLLQA